MLSKSPASRNPHLSEDRLAEVYFLASEDAHLETCETCSDRYNHLVSILEGSREASDMEAGAIFTDARLHEQRDRILRRLERHGHAAEVLPFPNRAAGHYAPHRLLGPTRRWVAGAAAAGLVAGLFLGFAVDRRVGSVGSASIIER